MRFQFIGPYLFDNNKRIGTIKDNKTIKIIEGLLNGVDMKKNYKLDFRCFLECNDIDEAINIGQSFAKTHCFDTNVELVGVTEIYFGDYNEDEKRDDE